MNKVKDFLKIFTLNGFKDQGKAHIIGFISFYFSIIFTIGSLIFSLYTYYTPYKLNKEIVVKKLSDMESSGRWSDLKKELKVLENDADYKDIYYLYKGRIAARITQVPKVNPDFYFSRVDIESPYYREVLQSRVTNYLINFHDNERTSKFKSLANEMRDNKLNYDYYYFFVRLLSLDNYNYQSVFQLYEQYSNLYTEYSIDDLKFHTSTTEVGAIDFNNQIASDVQSLYLIFLTELLYLGQQENIASLPKNLDRIKEELSQRESFTIDQVMVLLNFLERPNSFDSLQITVHTILTQ